MKRIIIPLLLISAVAYSQPYASIGFTNKGVNGGIGVLAGGIEMNISYDHPMSRVDKPAVLSLSAGKLFMITEDNEGKYWTAVTSVGYANCTYSDLSTYESDGKITKVSKFMPLYTIDLGYNSNLGRISFVAKRCETMYYGIQMRCFFYR